MHLWAGLSSAEFWPVDHDIIRSSVHSHSLVCTTAESTSGRL